MTNIVIYTKTSMVISYSLGHANVTDKPVLN